MLSTHACAHRLTPSQIHSHVITHTHNTHTLTLMLMLTLTHPHTHTVTLLHTTHSHTQTEHGGGCLEQRQDLVCCCFQECGGSRLCPAIPNSALGDSWGQREAENHPEGLPQPGQGGAALTLVWTTTGDLWSCPFFPLASPAVPGASLRLQPHCHLQPGQGCMDCCGGKDGARKRKSVFPRGLGKAHNGKNSSSLLFSWR